MKTVCENCGKVIDTLDALHIMAYQKLAKYRDTNFCSIQCLAEFFKKEVDKDDRNR